MMNRNMAFRITMSLLLIALGTLTLLANLQVVKFPWKIGGGDLLWIAVFGFSGIVFLGIFLKDKKNWWAIIPGFTLIGLGVILGDLFPPEFEYVAVAILFSLLGFSFLSTYLVNRQYWGLLAPTGLMLTFGIQTIFSSVVTEKFNSVILLSGFTLTVLWLYFTLSQYRKWLLYIAAVFGYFACMLAIGAVANISIFIPAFLVLIGGLFVWRTFRPGMR